MMVVASAWLAAVLVDELKKELPALKKAVVECAREAAAQANSSAQAAWLAAVTAQNDQLYPAKVIAAMWALWLAAMYVLHPASYKPEPAQRDSTAFWFVSPLLLALFLTFAWAPAMPLRLDDIV